MQKPLREAINDVVVQYVTGKLQRGEPVDVAFMAREMSLPLIDMIMEQDEKHRGALLAQIMGTLGNEYLERRGLLQTGRRNN
jgi:DNA-binding protein Fis